MKPHVRGNDILEMARGFQAASVVIAGAELDVFTILRSQPLSAAKVAGRIQGDLRATVVLLDALAALRLLEKDSGRVPVYRVSPAGVGVLTETGSQSRLGMVRHLGNCLRNWAQLARVVRCGRPSVRRPSVRGVRGDLTSFIRAMHEVSVPMARPLIRSLGPLKFTHLLDVGGASGTWTIPFLQLNPEARATVFDQPEVIPMARRLMTEAGLTGRVRFVAGSYHRDRLPSGADLAWVSAIVHQNSRAQNRAMFARIHSALMPGGKILIRDIVMDPSRTRPAGGALFAVNMLVATPGGGTFTFGELREDLSTVGFGKVRYLHRGEGMDSVLCAVKPVSVRLRRIRRAGARPLAGRAARRGDKERETPGVQRTIVRRSRP
jgi:precorrin-6B methylase 2